MKPGGGLKPGEPRMGGAEDDGGVELDVGEEPDAGGVAGGATPGGILGMLDPDGPPKAGNGLLERFTGTKAPFPPKPVSGSKIGEPLTPFDPASKLQSQYGWPPLYPQVWRSCSQRCTNQRCQGKNMPCRKSV